MLSHHRRLLRGTALLVVAALWSASALNAQPPAPESGAGQELTIEGEVIDPASYLKEGVRGAEHTDETYEALDSGQTPALLETSTGTVYLFLASAPGEDPSSLVYDYVNQTVKVTGRVFERGGLRGIVPSDVQGPATLEGAAPVGFGDTLDDHAE